MINVQITCVQATLYWLSFPRPLHITVIVFNIGIINTAIGFIILQSLGRNKLQRWITKSLRPLCRTQNAIISCISRQNEPKQDLQKTVVLSFEHEMTQATQLLTLESALINELCAVLNIGFFSIIPFYAVPHLHDVSLLWYSVTSPTVQWRTDTDRAAGQVT